ncbi:bacterial regulatory helix-turn-helix, lysR family protein [Collimonas arenae]|nr:LysR family transcriptional regulator [Collimonas arenae]AMP00184.1 bacterial regulatory helix-turn-helix, lysR family protein [Collimonas arenae]
MKSHQLQETSLRYFLEVVRCGSISEASQRLNVASSAISRQITGLEQILDTVLFERRPRGMVLSAGGEVLAAHALKSALEADRVVADLLSLKGLKSGRIRIASTEGFAIDFLPRLISDFQKKYPAIVFQLYVGPPASVSRQVREGNADIGLTFSRIPEPNIKVVHQQPAPVMAIMRKDHPLSQFKQVSLSQLAAYPIALPEPNTTLRQLFDLACNRQQLLFEPVLTSNYVEALYNFVMHSGGVSISGEVSVRDRVAEGKMLMLPIRDRGLDGRQVEVQTLIGRTLPRVVETFLDYLLNHLRSQ